jgi:hypothetical protein
MGRRYPLSFGRRKSWFWNQTWRRLARTAGEDDARDQFGVATTTIVWMQIRCAIVEPQAPRQVPAHSAKKKRIRIPIAAG